MKNDKERSIWSKILPSLITAAILSLCASVIPGGWNWVFSTSKAFGLWFISPVTIPIWLLVTLSLLSITIVGGGAVLLVALVRGSPDEEYTEELFFGVRWRWKYVHGDIEWLSAFCPECDIQIYPKERFPLHVWEYHCDECQLRLHEFHTSPDELQRQVKLKIQQKLRTKSTKK